MNILKREEAPISKEAWREIDESARDVLVNTLRARRALKINGPKGWDFPAVAEGRLDIIEEDRDDTEVSKVCTGTYKVAPLLEARINFNLNRFELDNIDRGAKDADLDKLEEACEKIALFEDNVLFNGYKDQIVGLSQGAGHKYQLGRDANEILKNIGQGLRDLKNSYVSGDFDLIVSEEAYDLLNRVVDGAYLLDIVRKKLGGEVIESKASNGAILLAHKHDDYEFTLGHDLSIGYHQADPQNVGLFISESFTLRILDENKIVAYSL